MFLVGFPLLLIPFAIYNIIAFLMPGVAWNGTVATVQLPSGAEWTIALSDLLLGLAVILLIGELAKTAHHKRSLVDRALSFILFAGMAAEFVWVRQAATATFFLLLIISFIDVVGGLAVTRRAVARELVVERVEPAS